VLLLRGNHDIAQIGWENEKLISVQDKAMIEVDSIKIYAEHYPCAAFNGDYHVYGHVHTLSDGICYGMDAEALKAMKRVTYDVGVDQNNYTPISYWQLCDIIRKQLNEGVPAKKG
jgi:calcineurin-like phosphoesterase family protein